VLWSLCTFAVFAFRAAPLPDGLLWVWPAMHVLTTAALVALGMSQAKSKLTASRGRDA
jgi:hypothetical protein